MDAHDSPQEQRDATDEFQQELEHLILTMYAKGVPLEDTWTITVSVADAPDWTVTIEKSYSEKTPSYQPSLLDE